MNKMSIRTTAVAIGLALSLGSAASHAGGFLGDLINQVAPGVGTTLDQWNHEMGNPVDHAFAGVADTFIPGAGSALEAGWALQRSGGAPFVNIPPEYMYPNYAR